MQDHAKEATVNRQPVVITVIDQAMLPEPVHEITYPGPGRADHLCIGLRLPFLRPLAKFGPSRT